MPNIPPWPSFLNPVASDKVQDRAILETEFPEVWKRAHHDVRYLVYRTLERMQIRTPHGPEGRTYGAFLPTAGGVRTGLIADEQFVDDVVQLVAVALVRATRRGGVRAAISALRAWLRRTTQRITMVQVRRAAHLMFALDADGERSALETAACQADCGTSCRSAELQVLSARADAIVAELDSRSREVLQARLDGKSHAEIAEELGISAAHSRLVLHRALRLTQSAVTHRNC